VRYIALVLLLPLAVAGAAIIDVRDALGYPVQNATVCVEGLCKYTNATGLAEVPTGSVEIYVDGILAWRTYAEGHVVATIYRVGEVAISPLPADGHVDIWVKLLNGTYTRLKINFRNNTLEREIPVGNVNYPAEIYIASVAGHAVNITVKTTLWELGADLAALGIVKKCTISAREPVKAIYVYNGTNLIAVGQNVTLFMFNTAAYYAVVETDVVAPNGTRYRWRTDVAKYCGGEIMPSASKLIVTAVDSAGTVRYDWAIRIANESFRGRAELWVLPNATYTVEVDAVHTKKSVSVHVSRAVEEVTISVPTAYIEFRYQQPARWVYIIGNYTTKEAMPRRVEVPPGVYKVVVDLGGVNMTYTVALRSGEVVTLTVERPLSSDKVAQHSEGPPVATYALVAVLVAFAVVAIVILKKSPRRSFAIL